MKEAEKYLGKQIAQFRLVRFIAKGAMGMVFEAQDVTLDRKVAIKLVPKEEDEEDESRADDVRRRFIQEAKVAGQLSHPNIVTVHSYGETDELQYICMEYVEGETLFQLLKTRRRLDPEAAYLIFEQILPAIEAAHKRKIVHRDIKPANIMITPSGQVKIMDFGIARDPSLALTGKGMILGTPYYMSPEQVSGLPLDTRSDIFSAGAVLYQVLTGHKPFDGETASTLICMIVHAEPVPPRDLNERLPQGLCPIIGKAMAKNPDKRYRTALEMLDALRAAMGKEAPADWTPAASDRSAHGVEVSPSPPGAGKRRTAFDKDHTPADESAREIEPPVPGDRIPDTAPRTGSKKSLHKRLVFWLCVLFLAGGAAAVFLRPAGLPYGARFKELSLQNAGFALKELFVHIASKTFLGSLIQSTTPGSAPKPSVSGSTPAPPVRLAGTYRVEGANPDGTRYSGTATISPSGDRLLMTWVVSNRVFTGTGTFSGQALTIYWSDSGGRTGVMVYTLTQGGVLMGSWADGKGTETLIPAP